MNRREFLAEGGCALAAASLPRSLAAAPAPPASSAPRFQTSNTRWQAAYDKALSILSGNVRQLPHFAGPVLIEGSQYLGIWQESGPQEALLYSAFNLEAGRNGHMVFFALQHEDGQLPANNKVSETGFGQIQMVVPIAATAWELAEQTGDQQLLEAAYRACSRWDDWLMRYRNTRGTGLIEGFCTYDTGHDNSPRWAGIPPQCPDKDARRCPPIPTLPRLCPDLSATTYGGRVALAAMAKALGKTGESERWLEAAGRLQALILAKLFVPEDGAFYDLDAQDHLVRVRSDVISRVCGEHVVDQKVFDSIWQKQLGNPQAFWAPYPFSSIAMNDPSYHGDSRRNAWNGPSQALTALRAPRWMDHYGRHAELAHLMDRWCEALERDMTFRQQMNPVTGEFAPEDKPGYSPACLLMVDFTWRLAGVQQQGEELWWSLRPGYPAAERATFEIATRDRHVASLTYQGSGATLKLNHSPVAELLDGIARLVTTTTGKPTALVGISPELQHVRLKIGGTIRPFTLAANQRIPL